MTGLGSLVWKMSLTSFSLTRQGELVFTLEPRCHNRLGLGKLQMFVVSGAVS